MPLCLIRHTRVAAPAGLCYGQFDVPLADTFAEEAQAVREALAHQFPAGLPPIWSSPSLRCRSLAETLDAPFRLDPRLRELNFGDWEGRTWAELDSPEARHWGDNWQTAAPPQGESLPELLQRLRNFLAETRRADPRAAPPAAGRSAGNGIPPASRPWRAAVPVNGRSLRTVP